MPVKKVSEIAKKLRQIIRLFDFPCLHEGVVWQSDVLDARRRLIHGDVIAKRQDGPEIDSVNTFLFYPQQFSLGTHT